MYKLYYLPGSCSMAVHVLLNEIGAKFELENIAVPDGQARSAEFLKINPRGSAPVLKIDDSIIREGAAILIYLLDSNKNSLLPEKGIERAKALEWLAFANATLHPAYARIFFMHRHLGQEAEKNPLYDIAISQIQKHWDEIEQHLSGNDYLCGKNLTIADILVTVIANWTGYLKKPILFGPKTKAFFTKIISLPSYQKALQTEGVTYKANL